MIGIGGDELDVKNSIGTLVNLFTHYKDNIILVSHVPPKNVCDLCNDGRNVGVSELAKIIETFQPVLCLFGHIHEEAGKKAIIGNTTCVNVGPNGAFIEIENDKIEVIFL